MIGQELHARRTRKLIIESLDSLSDLSYFFPIKPSNHILTCKEYLLDAKRVIDDFLKEK